MPEPTEAAQWTVLDTAALLRDEADRRIADRVNALPQGGKEIRCRAACAACCRQAVVVSPLEALALREYVEARPHLAAEIRERTATWEQHVEDDAPLRERLQQFEEAGGYLPDVEGGHLELEYWQRQLSCPFLDGGLCSVYAVRPFACREHLVVSDPALCAVSPDAATSAGVRLEYRTLCSEVGAEAFALEDRLILLPRALDYAGAHPEQGLRRAAAERVCELIADAQRRIRMALARLFLAQRAAKPPG